MIESSSRFPTAARMNRAYTSPVNYSTVENLTPLRQQLPPTGGININPDYVSPRPPPSSGQALVRTHSSPSIIDASPKTKGGMHTTACSAAITPSPTSVFGHAGGPFASRGSHHAHAHAHAHSYAAASASSGLTPIANNRTRARSPYCNPPGSNSKLEALSVPEEQSFKSAFRVRNQAGQGQGHTESNSRYKMILPRQEHHNYNHRAELKPISPPHWPSRTSPDSVAAAPPPEQRHESPPTGSIFVNQGGYRVMRTHSTHRLPSSPGNNEHNHDHDHAENIAPYEPDRDSRLASYGIVRDDAGSIFLSSPPIDNRRSGQHTSEADDMMDDTDISIPSIHLATSLPSAGNDSYTTIEEEKGDSFMEEDESVAHRENVMQDLPRWGSCFPEMHMNMVHALSPNTILRNDRKKQTSKTNAYANANANANAYANANANANPYANANAARSSSRKQSSSRYMSPEKEREVFDWLHSLEIEKDNNEYIAEAASSKFLTGKLGAGVDELALSSHECVLEPQSQPQPQAQLDPCQNVYQQHVFEPAECASSIPPSSSNKVEPIGHMSTATREEVEKPPRQVMGRRVTLRSSRPKGGSERRVLRSCSGM